MVYVSNEFCASKSRLEESEYGTGLKMHNSRSPKGGLMGFRTDNKCALVSTTKSRNCSQCPLHVPQEVHFGRKDERFQSGGRVSGWWR